MSLKDAILPANEPSGNPKTHVTSTEATVLFPSILKIVAESYLLGRKDLGLLLLLTTKEMTAAAFPSEQGEGSNTDAVWNLLCCTDWGEDPQAATEQKFGEAYLQAITSYEELPFELRPLQYSPQDYDVVVSFQSIGEEDNEPFMFCKSIPGEELPEFFETGHVDVAFDESLCLLFQGESNGFTYQYWEGKVHIIRKTDKKVIQLARFVYEMDLKWSPMEIEVTEWYGHLSSHDPPMKNKYGQALLSAFFDEDCDFAQMLTKPDILDHLEPASGGGIDIFGFSLTSFMVHGYGVSEEWDSGSIAGNPAVQENQVTFAHFLEALDEWNYE